MRLRLATVLLSLLFCPSSPAEEKPREAAAPPAAKESFHLYLLIGQSNMVGRDTLGMDGQKENPAILSLDADGRWVVALDPLHPQVGNIACGVGPGISFAGEMLKADSKDVIGLIPCAVGGTPLKRWIKGGDLYQKAVERAKLAAPAGTLKGVLWHQGESDTAKQGDAESYEKRLSQMFADLRADLDSPALPIVIGQLGEFLSLTPEKNPFSETVRAALKRIPDVVPHAGLADSTRLDHKGDKLHFSAEAEREFGKRYAKVMLGLQKK